MALTNVYTNFGGRIVHENRKGEEYGYVPDPLGSTVALVDTSGAVTDTWEYWPYGEVESHSGSSTTPFTFVGTLGYFRDLVSSLTYVRARFYQALIGQWMSTDEFWPAELAYSYVLGNAITSTDPTGLGCTAYVGTKWGNGLTVKCRQCGTLLPPCTWTECQIHVPSSSTGDLDKLCTAAAVAACAKICKKDLKCIGLCLLILAAICLAYKLCSSRKKGDNSFCVQWRGPISCLCVPPLPAWTSCCPGFGPEIIIDKK